MFNNVPYDQYGPRNTRPYAPYPNQMPMYPPPIGPPRGPMPNNAVPQMPNNMGNNITVRDPFSEMDSTAHMSAGNPSFNANMGNNAYGAPGAPMGPGQYRANSMPNNDMYNQNMYAMRNSGAMPTSTDPYGMGRRDLPGAGAGVNQRLSTGDLPCLEGIHTLGQIKVLP